MFALNFNSHARVGRDVEQPEEKDSINDFNSHARVGRDYYEAWQ